MTLSQDVMLDGAKLTQKFNVKPVLDQLLHCLATETMAMLAYASLLASWLRTQTEAVLANCCASLLASLYC